MPTFNDAPTLASNNVLPLPAYIPNEDTLAALIATATDCLSTRSPDDTVLRPFIAAALQELEDRGIDMKTPRAAAHRFGCYALVIDNDDGCELELFRSEAERDEHMWNYAWENCDTEATTLDDFKAEYAGDLGNAMERTNDGWHTEEMTWQEPAYDHANDTVDALVQAESFIAGFEDDEMQEGIADLLTGIRAAIKRERARQSPNVLAALKHAWEEIQAWRRGLNHRNMNKCKVGATFIEERAVRAAIASIEAGAPAAPAPTVPANVLAFINQMANFTTPEDEFAELKEAAGSDAVEVDGVVYDDLEEFKADISDDRLMDEYSAFCSMIHQAREVRNGIEAGTLAPAAAEPAEGC